MTQIAETKTNRLTYSEVKPGSGLEYAMRADSSTVLKELQTSGLRGRGGAGFPTSFKWELAAKAEGPDKYVVCNADEGEPGTFKDRVILDKYADLVFEGMTIAAKVIGAKTGMLYLRAEYNYLRPQLETVLKKRRDSKLLGKNITAGFDFDIEIRMGAGAYVCGEETALIESLEGHRGEPRNRPPFPVDTGYLHNPTVVNNVETFAWVVCILAKGADWFKGSGTEKSRGRKLFSVSGDCKNPGVYEFSYGITVSELLKEVGGSEAKAVQIGGASGEMVPAKEFSRKIAYEDVSTGGSIIVFGQKRKMLDVTKNFLEFFMEESCGQCTLCREGTPKILEAIEQLEHGKGSMKYLRELVSLSDSMRIASKCGLGQCAPNAFVATMKHFSDEVMSHLNNH